MRQRLEISVKKTFVFFAFLMINAVWANSVIYPAPAPSWELDELDGGTRRLEEWRGKWVLLKLGRTDCPNCSIELQEMFRIREVFERLGVEILDVYLREKSDRVKKYLGKLGIELRRTVLYDWRGSLVSSYGVSIIPHLLLLDPNGEIKWQGEFTQAEELSKLLMSHVQGGSSGGK